jgi:hypothetical protein
MIALTPQKLRKFSKWFLKNLFTSYLLFLSIWAAISVSPVLPGDWVPEVQITNGTTGRPGSVDSLKLIAITTGMQPLGEVNGFSYSTKISNMNLPDESPILFQARYRGATYNKMVPPAPIFRSKPIEIIVYETTQDLSSLDVKSVIQITREENVLRFLKVYIFSNTLNPPKSYVPLNSMEIYLPEKAQNIRGQYTQSDSKMGIPLALEKGEFGRKFDRAVLPGQSDLMISFDILANPEDVTSFDDKILFEKESSRIFLLNPPEMKLSMEGSTQADQMIEKGPEGMLGVKFNYKNKEANISIQGGKPIVREVAQERRVINGSLFTNWVNSTYGVFAIVGILFSLSFLFVFNQNKI